MFEVGFTEIVLILGLALLVLGPEKLPGLAQKVGRWTGRARSMARQLRTQLEQEVTLEEQTRSKPAAPPESAANAASSTEPHIHTPPAPEPPYEPAVEIATPTHPHRDIGLESDADAANPAEPVPTENKTAS